MTRNAWFVITVCLILSGMCIPYFYTPEFVPVQGFFVTYERNWFLRDLWFGAALAISPFIAFIKEARFRHCVAVIYAGIGVKEFLDFILWNNEFSPLDNVIQYLLTLIGIYFILRFVLNGKDQ